ncbi:fructosamine kinase family protein [Tuberibacillus sp. Marseille-P3662]|uniref:fructosamine kinase family protein n=1 Tax=Tuberibacillus sp. Marseille-P3662 TaxID=1965358 RepID=UPI0020CAA64D|nr:fructosamine kinase family protein [Tuberibacillus sp. Marseille-P3662]
MEPIIEEALHCSGDESAIQSSRAVSGGCINQTYYVKTKAGEYFVKLNADVPQDFFRREAEGLELIRETNTVMVPNVLYYNEPADHEMGVLVQEWLGGGRQMDTSARLGREVAALHATYGSAFGLANDNYVGELRQPNGWYDSWVDYYREQRLLKQVEYGEQVGRMPLERRRKMESLMERLNQWIPSNIRPSLLHGDLWGGNFMAGPEGEPVLIDPAVLYGHHEFDMAFTEMFGGFSQDFFDHYYEVFPPEAEYQERKHLYQLFYLLVHLNTFGGMYAQSVDRVLDRFV